MNKQQQKFQTFSTHFKTSRKLVRNISSAVYSTAKPSQFKLAQNRRSNQDAEMAKQIKNKGENGDIPSFNKLQIQFRASIQKQHEQKLKMIEQKLKQISKIDLNKQHRQIIQKIKKNNESELLKPILEGVNFNTNQINLQNSFKFNNEEETFNQQLQFQVPTTFQFYINSKKKALFQSHQKEKVDIIKLQNSHLLESDKRKGRKQQNKQKKIIKRYDSWYMPKKYWSKIKQCTQKTHTLYNIKNDPGYLYKNLYNQQKKFILNERTESGDINFLKQQQTYQKNKIQLRKSEEILKKLQKQICKQGNKSWILKYRISNSLEENY